MTAGQSQSLFHFQRQLLPATRAEAEPKDPDHRRSRIVHWHAGRTPHQEHDDLREGAQGGLTAGRRHLDRSLTEPATERTNWCELAPVPMSSKLVGNHRQFLTDLAQLHLYLKPINATSAKAPSLSLGRRAQTLPPVKAKCVSEETDWRLAP